MFEKILLARGYAFLTYSSARLAAVFGQTRTFDIPCMGNGHHHFFVGYHVFDGEIAASGGTVAAVSSVTAFAVEGDTTASTLPNLAITTDMLSPLVEGVTAR